MGVNDDFFFYLDEGEVRTVLVKEAVDDQHPSICSLVKYVWSNTKNVDKPQRKEFDPKDIQSLLPSISILGMIYDNGIFKDANIRLFGTDLVSVYGELTGNMVSEYSNGSVATRSLDDCRLVVDTKKIVVGSSASLDEERNFIKLKKVLIPFFDDTEDKYKVTQIVSLIKFSS